MDPEAVFGLLETQLLGLLPPEIATADIHWESVGKIRTGNPYAVVAFIEVMGRIAHMGKPGTRQSDQFATLMVNLFSPVDDGDAWITIKNKRTEIERDLNSNPPAGVGFTGMRKTSPGSDGAFIGIGLAADMRFESTGH